MSFSLFCVGAALAAIHAVSTLKPYALSGAHNRNRTDDLFLTKEVLYRLSYVGEAFSADPGFPTAAPSCIQAHDVERVVGIEPTSSAWKAEVLPLNYTRIPSHRVHAGIVGRQRSRATRSSGKNWWRG